MERQLTKYCFIPATLYQKQQKTPRYIFLKLHFTGFHNLFSLMNIKSPDVKYKLSHHTEYHLAFFPESPNWSEDAFLTEGS